MISVVIPTLNAADRIGPTLGALSPAILDPILSEVILTDGGSTDDVAEIADRRRAERSDEGHGGHEDSGVHGGADADVANTSGTTSEVISLDTGPSEELDEHRSADVEALGHCRVHRCVELHRLPGDVGHPGADPT